MLESKTLVASKSILGEDEDGLHFDFGKSVVVAVADDVVEDDDCVGTGYVGVVKGRGGCLGCCYGTGSDQKRCRHTPDAVDCCETVGGVGVEEHHG